MALAPGVGRTAAGSLRILAFLLILVPAGLAAALAARLLGTVDALSAPSAGHIPDGGLP